MRIFVVIGTRPEAIKMLPLVIELRKNVKNEVVVCHSGQHRELAEEVFDCFGVSPDLRCDCKAQGLTEMTNKYLEYFDMIFKEKAPDIVLVHGDTATAFCASLAAFYNRILIAHIEAGLRTFDKDSPFPEEVYRVGIDAMADLHFAPTPLAAHHLSNEGGKRAFVVGNTGLDALKYTLKENYVNSDLCDNNGEKTVLITCHRRENIGTRMENALLGIKDYLSTREDVTAIVSVHPNPAVRRIVESVFSDVKNIKICKPLKVQDFHNILSRCLFVVTDSGGIQEEATYLGIPVFLLRDKTERQEGVALGNVKIIGTDREGVAKALKSITSDKESFECMSVPSHIFGDGRASERIADILSSSDFQKTLAKSRI